MFPIDHALIRQVSDAFTACGSTLALARSPLAHGPITAPGLVLDELAPTLDERGLALRHALQWAVEQLAPEAAPFPFGSARPLDDPTWRDPRWWRYTLLRHRYLEPIPAAELAPGERPADALRARTAIPSADLLYEERDRALREAAQWLQRHARQGVGADRICALALAAVWEPLADQAGARTLLGVASVFPGVFPARRLLALAAEENLRYPERALDVLIGRRCLHAGEGGAALWMAPALRSFVEARQLAESQRRRHLFAARLARDDGDPIAAARHLLDAGLPHQAATVLLSLDEERRAEANTELLPLLQRADEGSAQLAADERRAFYLLQADLLARANQSDAAVAACREALKSTFAAREQAIIHHRIAKLHEEQNPAQALVYYNLAAERLEATHSAPPDADLGSLLKDRGWLALLRGDDAAAEADLTRALDLTPPADLPGRADIHDALSALRRSQGDTARAVEHARTALALREQAGDPLRLGRAYNALGILYRVLGDYAAAIDAYQRSREIFEGLDNPASVATALLNIGTAHHFAEQLDEAERSYRQCLALADEAGLTLTEVRARANLAEALMDRARHDPAGEDEARLHWRAAYALSVQAGFEDEIAYLRELCVRLPALEAELATVAHPAAPARDLSPSPFAGAFAAPFADIQGAPAGLDADEARALDEAQRIGRVSASSLMATAQVSKATATRKLARLEQAGLLVRHGQGRSTFYTRAHAVPAVILAGDLAGLQTRLDAVLPRFARSHGLERLEASRVAQTAAPGGESDVCYDVRALFRRLPELRAFFDLERALSEATRTRINLTI